MSKEQQKLEKKSLGIIGFGAFGMLIAQHINRHFEVFVYDHLPGLAARVGELGVTGASLKAVAQCDVIVLATPVSRCAEVVTAIAPFCRPGALVIDVGSVKVQPSEIMAAILPDHVHIVATHPLFGPESGRNGITGLKIAICPIRGARYRALARFLSAQLGLQVIQTTPEEHDREAATVQGLTHLIAKILSDMGPLPTRMTTRSFDLLVQAISMVQNDAPEVFDAIERANPYAAQVRRVFFERALELNVELGNAEI